MGNTPKKIKVRGAKVHNLKISMLIYRKRQIK